MHMTDLNPHIFSDYIAMRPSNMMDSLTTWSTDPIALSLCDKFLAALLPFALDL